MLWREENSKSAPPVGAPLTSRSALPACIQAHTGLLQADRCPALTAVRPDSQVKKPPPPLSFLRSLLLLSLVTSCLCPPPHTHTLQWHGRQGRGRGGISGCRGSERRGVAMPAAAAAEMEAAAVTARAAATNAGGGRRRQQQGVWQMAAAHRLCCVCALRCVCVGVCVVCVLHCVCLLCFVC